MLPDRGLSDEELVARWMTISEGFGHTQHRLRSDLERGTRLAGSWFDVLVRLVRTPDHRLPMHRIVADMAISSGGFTKLADRMTDAGLVERQASVADRRVIFLALTDEGRQTIERAVPGYVAAVQTHVLDQISAQDMTTLATVLRELGAQAEAEVVETSKSGRPTTSATVGSLTAREDDSVG